MAYNPDQVADVITKLTRAQRLHDRALVVAQTAKLIVDENDTVDDSAITNAGQVSGYVTLLRSRRDALVASVQPVVAGWN